jgi:hypothetical protein
MGVSRCLKASDRVIARGKSGERQIYRHGLKSRMHALGENTEKDEFEFSNSQGASEHDEKAIEVPGTTAKCRPDL